MDKDTLCALTRDLMPLYLDGVTGKETSGFVEKHLAECGECRKVRREMLGVSTPTERAQTELLGRLRKERLKRRKRAWLIALSILLALAVCFLPLPVRVDIETEGYLWQIGNENYPDETRDVSVHGWYLNYLFRADVFSGDLMIEGYPVTQVPGALHGRTYVKDGALFYASRQYDLECTGTFSGVKAGMKEFVIRLFNEEGSWTGEDGLMLTVPASDRDEAVRRANELARYTEMKWSGYR